MTPREVAHGSPEYDRTVELRRAVLRRPLGLDFTEDQLAAERDDTHLALFEGGEATACLILTLVSPLPSGGEGAGGEGQSLPTNDPRTPTLKMRQVAVRPDGQRKGRGRALVEAAETLARDRGFRTMVLNARGTAVPFYLALGYVPEGEPFEEVGLPHRAMRKAL